MTTASVLGFLRRKLAAVDLATSDLTDEELLAAIDDRRRSYAIRQWGTFVNLAVGTDQDDEDTYGIIPDPTDEEGTALALGAAIDLLEQQFLGRLDRGEIGTTWSSGLESESTVQAAKAYGDRISEIQSELTAIKLISRAPTSATRPQ